MNDGRLTVRFSPDEMATLERMSAALNMPKSAIVKLAVSKLYEGKGDSEKLARIDQLERAIFRTVRMLWITRGITDTAKLGQVEGQLLEIWKHVEQG